MIIRNGLNRNENRSFPISFPNKLLVIIMYNDKGIKINIERNFLGKKFFLKRPKKQKISETKKMPSAQDPTLLNTGPSINKKVAKKKIKYINSRILFFIFSECSY